jgi:hypothetical protein
MQEEAKSPEGSENQAGIEAAVQNAENATIDDKVNAHEHYLIQLLQGFEVSGHAINRLERFTFALVKVLLDREIFSFPEYEKLMEEVMSYDDLTKFWGVSSEDSDAPAETAEEAAD